ncbi:cation:proton antiporter [Candidatus Woesearchaeota archaeon]|nr:MAG: cation:proton antiporter [Candidatus Woesearchaeota archaeon]
MLEQTLVNLGILFLFVVIGGIIATRFKQPIGIGLLLVGAIIGPFALNLVNDASLLTIMIEFGAILLMFVLGLESAVFKLTRMGFKVLLMGLLKIGISIFITYEVLTLIGVSSTVALLTGVIISMSSTVVIIKVLKSKGLYDRQELPLLIGILIVEDVFSVVVLTLLTKANGPNLFAGLENLFIAMIVVGIVYFLVLKFAKAVIEWFVKQSGEEATTFIALLTCIGFSYFTYAIGLSPAIGAFLAGTIVASLQSSKTFKESVMPYTDMFSALFFVSIGTMINFVWVKNNLPLLGILVIVIFLTRFIGIGLMGHLFANFKKEQAIFASLTMVAIGEFPLLMAHTLNKLGLGVDFISLSGSLLLISAVIMSIFIGMHSHVSTKVFSYQLKGDLAKSSKLSDYLRRFSDELDIETVNTRKLKSLTGKFGLLFVVLIFALIGVHKLFVLLAANHVSLGYFILIGVAALALIGYLVYNLNKLRKQVHDTLLLIVSSLDGTSTSKRSHYVLNTLIRTMMLFFFALASPLVIAIFHLPGWTNFISLAILVFVVFKMMKVMNFIHSSNFTKSFPKYKKFTDVRPKGSYYDKLE